MIKYLKVTTLLAVPIATAFFLLSSFSGNDLRYPGGSPAGYTGSPGDGKNCTQCHGGSASPVFGWITSDIPDSGYEPGMTYEITATVSGNGEKGFLISPQNEAGEILGSLTPGSGTKFASGNSGYVTQSSSSSSNPKVWKFDWTAPMAGTGDVVFYGAFTVNEPVTKLDSYSVPENISIGIGENLLNTLKVSPNPCSDYLIIRNTSGSEFSGSLFDSGGQKVLEVRDAGREADMRLDMTALSPGIYFMNLQLDNQSVVKKIIKK
jgi:hypothetical protein